MADHLGVSAAVPAKRRSVVCTAIERAGCVLSKRVLVTGCGPSNSLLIGGLWRVGAAHIATAALSNLALDCKRRVGADETIKLRRQRDGLDPHTKDKGRFDAVFDACGSEAALRTGLNVITPRGTLATVDLRGCVALPMKQIVAQEIELRGSLRFDPRFATAAQFPIQSLIGGTAAITLVVPLKDALSAFDLAADEGQSLKEQIALTDARTKDVSPGSAAAGPAQAGV